MEAKEVARGVIIPLEFRSPAQTNRSTWILNYIHPVDDFPKRGVRYQWYAKLLNEPLAFRKVIKEFAERYKEMKLEAIAAIDSRGFIFGSALAYKLGLPFIMIRKPGKLPGELEKIDYECEYESGSFEIQKESLQEGKRVLIIDDVIATGGTAKAACALIDKLNAKVVEVACMIEITVLKGRERIPRPVFSLVAIDKA